MKQILLTIVIASLAVWSIVSLVQDFKRGKEKSKGVEQEKVDLSEVEIIFGENDLITPYPDSLMIKAAPVQEISANSTNGYILINKKTIRPGTTIIDSVFKFIGTPQRYRTIVRNLQTYIYDEQGIYVIADSMGVVSSLNIHFRNGKLSISPQMSYTKSFEINGYEIYSNSTRLELIRAFGLTEIKMAGKSSYVVDANNIRLLFDFDLQGDNLIKVSIKLAGSNQVDVSLINNSHRFQSVPLAFTGSYFLPLTSHLLLPTVTWPA
jgi:hypothetical protein